MKFLLDTHVFLWFLREPEKLPSHVVQEIIAAGHFAAVSTASLWEIAIKVSLNKLQLPKDYGELFPHAIPDSGLRLLPIEPTHLAGIVHLPWHHRDPFDRLLVAQAKTEGLTIISGDAKFSEYGVSVLW